MQELSLQSLTCVPDSKWVSSRKENIRFPEFQVHSEVKALYLLPSSWSTLCHSALLLNFDNYVPEPSHASYANHEIFWPDPLEDTQPSSRLKMQFITYKRVSKHMPSIITFIEIVEVYSFHVYAASFLKCSALEIRP